MFQIEGTVVGDEPRYSANPSLRLALVCSTPKAFHRQSPGFRGLFAAKPWAINQSAPHSERVPPTSRRETGATPSGLTRGLVRQTQGRAASAAQPLLFFPGDAGSSKQRLLGITGVPRRRRGAAQKSKPRALQRRGMPRPRSSCQMPACGRSTTAERDSCASGSFQTGSSLYLSSIAKSVNGAAA